LAGWEKDGLSPLVIAKRLIDLFVVSVLVDGESPPIVVVLG
jgi:hypothetical protein